MFTTKEKTMIAVYLKAAVAGAFLLGFATAALATTGDEFANKCSGGLMPGKGIDTDCPINSRLQGNTYLLAHYTKQSRKPRVEPVRRKPCTPEEYIRIQMVQGNWFPSMMVKPLCAP
jgi:hypothetical protein